MSVVGGVIEDDTTIVEDGVVFYDWNYNHRHRHLHAHGANVRYGTEIPV